jgi:soluble lytic murein transglycosylase-like protein
MAVMGRERSGRGGLARAVGGALSLIVVAAALAGIVLALGLGERAELELDDSGEIARGASAVVGSESDPLAWDRSRQADFEARAAVGTSHVIYAKSPGGVIESARRTAQWRGRIEAAAERRGVDADTLEAIIFLESAGRPEAMAGPTPESASGLGQILPSTGTELLGMRVDLDRSIRLTRRVARADNPRRANLLRERRAEVDERFDPDAAIEGAATYLEIAGQRFGADDLAVVSYHMGIGNLESVIRAYLRVPGDAPTGALVADRELTYAQLYFDSAPDRNREAHRILRGFGDESADYLWKVRASEGIMGTYRDDPDRLARNVALVTAKATLEELFHPEDETEAFEEPDDIRDAAAAGELVALPESPRLGWVPDRRMGELASELDEPVELYRTLRPEALATLSYIGARVRELSGADEPLRVTSTARDHTYQELLRTTNHEATAGYSLHATGWSFDVLRSYQNRHQARAFQHVLDRLSALAVIDYAVEPRAIHVTVSKLGEELLPD